MLAETEDRAIFGGYLARVILVALLVLMGAVHAKEDQHQARKQTSVLGSQVERGNVGGVESKQVNGSRCPKIPM